jgi:hypothetical protein
MAVKALLAMNNRNKVFMATPLAVPKRASGAPSPRFG